MLRTLVFLKVITKNGEKYLRYEPYFDMSLAVRADNVTRFCAFASIYATLTATSNSENGDKYVIPNTSGNLSLTRTVIDFTPLYLYGLMDCSSPTDPPYELCVCTIACQCIPSHHLTPLVLCFAASYAQPPAFAFRSCALAFTLVTIFFVPNALRSTPYSTCSYVHGIWQYTGALGRELRISPSDHCELISNSLYLAFFVVRAYEFKSLLTYKDFTSLLCRNASASTLEKFAKCQVSPLVLYSGATDLGNLVRFNFVHPLAYSSASYLGFQHGSVISVTQCTCKYISVPYEYLLLYKQPLQYIAGSYLTSCYLPFQSFAQELLNISDLPYKAVIMFASSAQYSDAPSADFRALSVPSRHASHLDNYIFDGYSKCQPALPPTLTECVGYDYQNIYVSSHAQTTYDYDDHNMSPVYCNFAAAKYVDGIDDDEAPLYLTTSMHEAFADLDDDEVVICIDGEEVHSAWKRNVSQNSTTTEPPNADSFTMYKRVDRKVKPVPAVFPEDARVIRKFPEDPLKSLPPLPYQPPVFVPDPGGRLTEENLEEMNVNPNGFLLPEEEKLFIHILKLNQYSFVFEDSQRGSFREDYFSPYIIPIVPHEPWAFTNIPIPPGIKDKVVELLKEKIAAGIYEPSQSSYRSRWFCVLKKSGKLRLVHDLQPLNKVTIRDAGLPPNLDNFVEPFAGRQCYSVFDLYWGFDARKVHPKSRDMTAFLTPLGLLRITSLPTGFTNSPAEFQACMTFILQDEIPHIADIFIDDLPIKGPSSIYPDINGNPEVLPQNPGIRRFIWEHANDVHRILHRVGHAGGTFSPGKIQLCQPEVLIVGQKCTPEGRLPDEQKIEKILKWPTLKTVKDVRGFLGLCGTVRIWIKDYSQLARPLTELVRHDVDFEWDERRQQAFDALKAAITSPPALRPIDYTSALPVVLSVDSSFMAVGFILSQYDIEKKKRPARYGSIPMNERESRYSQPKLELYGLYRALRAYRLYLIGVQSLQVEVDAKYIKGMLNEPDLQPNATINRWIQGILLFDFELIHVPAERHKGPDALSRRELADDEEVESEDDAWLDNIALYSQTQLTHDDYTYHRRYSSYVLLSPKDQVLADIFRFLTTLQLPPAHSTLR